MATRAWSCAVYSPHAADGHLEGLNTLHRVLCAIAVHSRGSLYFRDCKKKDVAGQQGSRCMCSKLEHSSSVLKNVQASSQWGSYQADHSRRCNKLLHEWPAGEPLHCAALLCSFILRSRVLLPLVSACHALYEDCLPLIRRAELPRVEGHLCGTALWTSLLHLRGTLCFRNPFCERGEIAPPRPLRWSSDLGLRG